MKWINLAERQPVDVLWDHIIMRRLDNKHVQTDLEIAVTVNLPESWKEYEWLDESESVNYVHVEGDLDNQPEFEFTCSSDAEEGMMVIQVPIGSYVIPPDEIVTEPYSVDFISTNEKIKRMWELERLTKDVNMRAEYNEGLPIIQTYYRHQYLYWLNKKPI